MKTLFDFINTKIFKNKKILSVCTAFMFLFLCLPATAHAHGEGGVIVLFGSIIVCAIAFIFTIFSARSFSKNALIINCFLNLLPATILAIFLRMCYPADSIADNLLFFVWIPLIWFIFNTYMTILSENFPKKASKIIAWGIPCFAIFLFFAPYLLKGLEEIYYSKPNFLSKINFTSTIEKENFIYAIEKNDFDFVNKFISTHSDINIKDKDNKTPLHYAVKNGNEKIAKLLIYKGADINAKDNEEKTPLDYVRSEDMQQLLISHGAKSGEDSRLKSRE